MLSVRDLQPEEESQEKQQLYEACLKGSREEITRIFQNGNDTSAYFKDGMLPTHVVALAGRNDAEAILDMMLQNGFDVNARTKTGDDTLLHLVVENVKVKDAFPLVLKILEYSPDLNIRNRKLRTPYDIALAQGQFELAETLDGHFTAKEARDFYLKKIGALYGSKLLEAVIASKEKEIEEYIKLGADPNFVNEHQNGAIHYTVTHCNLPPFRTLTSLIGAGADVNLQDAEGDTALNLIIKSTKLRETGDMYKCAELLVQQGALSTYKDLDGNDALTLAKKKNYTDIIRLLSGRRNQHVQPTPEPIPPLPDLTEIEDDFVHPPPGSMENEEPEDEESIAQQRPPGYQKRGTPREPEVHRPPLQQTHLMNAVRFEGIDQVQVAIQDLQADPNKVDEEGFYALHYAVIREDIDDEERHEVIAALLDAGADVNVKTTEFGNTPLHEAAIINQAASAKQLLDTHKCNYNEKNMDGKTSYECAQEEGNQEVMDIIDKHRAAIRDKLRKGAKKASVCNIL